MFKQTLWLAKILPQCARIFRDADGKNSSEWEIVQWHNTPPADVTPDQVAADEVLSLNGRTVRNRFPNRSAAIRLAEKWATANDLSTEAIWLWKRREDDQSVYFTIMPTNRRAGATIERKTTPAATSSTLVRVSEQSHRLLKRLAAREGRSVQAVLDSAIEEFDRKSFFAELDRGYAALQADPAAWKEEMEERSAWDATLLDGLENDEWATVEAAHEVRKSA